MCRLETPVPPADEVAVPSGATERLAMRFALQRFLPKTKRRSTLRPLQTSTYLQRAFPRVHSDLQRETVAKHSLLYTWPGSDPTLKAILLVGHMDVVPVEPGTEDEWQQEPFGGAHLRRLHLGRGAIDNKSAVLGTLEAVEMLLADGFRPTRTVYLAYGHDEEVGGTNGARAIAALLESRGVALEMVLDEGGVIGDGVLPGITRPSRWSESPKRVS